MDQEPSSGFSVITIQNGALVSSRKGVQVSREKRGAIAFVNTAPSTIGRAKPTTSTALRFVNNGVADPIMVCNFRRCCFPFSSS